MTEVSPKSVIFAFVKCYSLMRKSISSLMLALVALLLMSGCVSTKKIVYFQESDEVFRQGQQIMQQYEMRYKPADQLLIKVTCSEPELLAVFSQEMLCASVEV